eukprot:tig00000655_g2888.t1
MAWRRLALVVAVLAVATLLPLTAGEAGATEEGAFDPQLGIPVKEISRIRDANVAFLFANRDRYGPGRHAPKRKLLPIFRELRPDAMTFFSLGPQEGDEIDEVLKLWPGFAGAIHTFEPAPRWIPHLEQKYRTQIAAGTVVLVPKAVSERDGTATMCDSGSCSRWTAGQLQVDRANGVLTERTGAIRMDTAVRLDSYVAQAVPGALPADPTGDPRAPELDMVMMDIEGYEAPALRGMRELLSRRRIAVLFFEYGPQWSDYVGDLFLGERAEAASVAEMPPERLRDAVAYLHALGSASPAPCPSSRV